MNSSTCDADSALQHRFPFVSFAQHIYVDESLLPLEERVLDTVGVGYDDNEHAQEDHNEGDGGAPYNIDFIIFHAQLISMLTCRTRKTKKTEKTSVRGERFQSLTWDTTSYIACFRTI